MGQRDNDPVNDGLRARFSGNLEVVDNNDSTVEIQELNLRGALEKMTVRVCERIVLLCGVFEGHDLSPTRVVARIPGLRIAVILPQVDELESATTTVRPP